MIYTTLPSIKIMNVIIIVRNRYKVNNEWRASITSLIIAPCALEKSSEPPTILKKQNKCHALSILSLSYNTISVPMTSFTKNRAMVRRARSGFANECCFVRDSTTLHACHIISYHHRIMIKRLIAR
jgi:hypothetical protein